MTTDTGEAYDLEATARTRRRDWWDFAATVILSLATVASAWSGYQAARWSGEKVKANRAATVARFEASNQYEIANQQRTVDVMIFSTWLEATIDGQDRLANATEERFRADFVPAFEEWMALGHPGELAPGSPFEMTSYLLPATVEAQRLTDLAEAESLEADEHNQTSDNFVLTAVLYASVLFFAGIANKISNPTSSHIAVGLSGTMFVLATIVMATQPLSVAF